MVNSDNTAALPSSFSYKIDNNRFNLYNQDCISGIRDLIKNKSIDMVVTSPPYNLGIDYNGYNDNQTRDKYLEWMEMWVIEIKRALKDDGSLFLNVGSKPKDPLIPFQLLEVISRHLKLQNVIHWIKSIAIMKSEVGNYPGITNDVVVGHYKPINSKRFLNDCQEYIFHLTKNADVNIDRLSIGVPYQDKSNIKRWGSSKDGLHCRGNTWFIPYETINSRDKDRPHPATFPIELPLRCMKLHGVGKDDLVMDPFLGIGSSAIAAARYGISFIGFEISKPYYDFACDRLTFESENLKINTQME